MAGRGARHRGLGPAWWWWLAFAVEAQAQALPPVAPVTGASASAAGTDAEVADRMARAKRVADDPLRRIREATRLPAGAASPAAPGAVAKAAGGPAPASAASSTGANAAPSVVTLTLPAAARRAATADPREAIGRLLIQVARETEAAAQGAAAEPVAAVLPAAADAAPVPASVAASVAASVPPSVAASVAAAPDRPEAALSRQSVAALNPSPPPSAAEPEAAYVPVLVQRVDPDFAGTVSREGQALRFQLRFSIAADGSVQDLVIQGGADRQAVRAVREAVSRWRYVPPGRPTPHTVELVVRFDA